jgi:hypothetical protein
MHGEDVLCSNVAVAQNGAGVADPPPCTGEGRIGRGRQPDRTVGRPSVEEARVFGPLDFAQVTQSDHAWPEIDALPPGAGEGRVGRFREADRPIGRASSRKRGPSTFPRHLRMTPPPGSIVSTGSQRSELQLSARAPPSRPPCVRRGSASQEDRRGIAGRRARRAPGRAKTCRRTARPWRAPAPRSRRAFARREAPVIRPFDVSEVPKGDDALGELL